MDRHNSHLDDNGDVLPRAPSLPGHHSAQSHRKVFAPDKILCDADGSSSYSGTSATTDIGLGEPQPSRQSRNDDESSNNAFLFGQRRMYHCTVCHKMFDRPSALRTHQRVHTLVKDYECSRCLRRFSVASNMKRHSRKCGDGAQLTAGISVRQSFEDKAPKPKRTRRKNAEPQWVPDSLKLFTVFGATFKLPMPLPPTELNVDDISGEPYKNEPWLGTLPGPASRSISRMDSTRSSSQA